MEDAAMELAAQTAIMPVTLFGETDPAAVVQAAAAHARVLKDVLTAQRLTISVSGKDYIRIEGWTLLGSMVGVFPVEVSTTAEPEDWRDRGLDKPDGFVSVVEARTRDGNVVGRANARCMRSERRWGTADDYAIASMAQTRAASKALRMPLGFIVVLAGYDATPAEEAGWAEPDAAPVAKKMALHDQLPGPINDAPESDLPSDPASSARWQQAVSLLGSRAEVVALYREQTHRTDTILPREITNAELDALMGMGQPVVDAS